MKKIRKGMRAQELWGWDVQDFHNKKGPMALQEHLQELIRNNPALLDRIVSLPPGADLLSWHFQNLRQFILEMNIMVTQMRQVCNRDSCPRMKSAEGVALCSAHKVAQECTAMEYAFHNLDQATSLLFGQKMFGRAASDTHRKHMQMIMRRLLRIFSHTAFSHKQFFRAFEQEMHLLGRFAEFNKKFELLPAKSF